MAPTHFFRIGVEAGCPAPSSSSSCEVVATVKIVPDRPPLLGVDCSASPDVPISLGR